MLTQNLCCLILINEFILTVKYEVPELFYLLFLLVYVLIVNYQVHVLTLWMGVVVS